MKYLLLIIAIVVGSYCWGQENIYGKLVTAKNNRDTICFDNVCCFMDSCWSIPPKQDTIKVLMLVCDTMGWPHTSVGSLIPGVQAYNEGRSVWWQFAYEVYEVQYGSIPCDITSGNNLAVVCYGWYRSKFIGRFDQNKKPLPKSIVVWMTKEIK